MPRRRKPRWIDFQPGVTYFKPRGVELTSLKEVSLTLDELEAIRLSDLDDVDQIKAAKRMKISQSTFQRILVSAHQKIAKALILGRAIKMEGGEIMMPRPRRRSAGGGRGRMGGPYAAGPGGACVCTNPECKNEVPHKVGVSCYEMKCEKCSSPMVRKRD